MQPKQKKRPVLRINLYEKNIDLYIDSLITVYPDKRAILLKYHPYYMQISDDPKDSLNKYGIFVTIPDPVTFNRIKFEYIRHIKTLPSPEDRVADYEWRDEQGLPDFEKLDRLIEKRKTAEEKKKELMEEIEIKRACEKYGIEYWGPLREET